MTYYCDTKLDAKKVSVTVDLDVNSDPRFSFQTNLPSKPKNKNHLIFSKGKKDGFVIRYELNDPNSVYTFGDDKDKALYSIDQPICPSQPGQWEQFYALCIEDSGLTLVVHNRNETQTEFGYTLRVIKAGDTDYLPLDPGGTNQNSNGSLYFTAVLMFAIAGAAIGAAVAWTGNAEANTAMLATYAGIGAIVALLIYFVVRGLRERTA